MVWALFVTRSRQVRGRVVDPETVQHEVEAISGIGEVKIPQFFLMDRKKIVRVSGQSVGRYWHLILGLGGYRGIWHKQTPSSPVPPRIPEPLTLIFRNDQIMIVAAFLSFSSSKSVITTSVERTSPAIEPAFWSPTRTTLAGSMTPFAVRFW